jgi:alpha-D-xyloside xylohydrolase
MDFTNPDVMDLWARLLDRFNQIGVDGYKLDYGEDVQVGFGGNRLFYSFHDGSNELTMHHRYATFYHQAYLNTLPPFDTTEEDNPHKVDAFVLGRSTTFGGQQYVHALWPGDLDSDFRTHLEEDYWVGGMPAGVIAGLTLAASGFPFFAADTGGFRNDRPTQEVLIRWAWQTAFSAIMQVGGGGTSHFPWAESSPNEPVYDEQGIQWMKEAAQWNLRLSDYRFTYGLKARRTGRPLLRPFGLAYPQDGRHPNDVYLLGPDLLVAPVFGESTRSIPLPEGNWFDFWTNELIVGPATVERTVPLGSQALFIRQGALIPLLDPEIQTLTDVLPNTTDAMLPSVRSILDDPGGLRFIVGVGQDARYLNHEGSQIELQSQQIVLTPGSRFPYFELDLHFDPQAPLPSSITVDQLPLIWGDESDWDQCTACLWDKGNGRLWVRLPPHRNQLQNIEWTL